MIVYILFVQQEFTSNRCYVCEIQTCCLVNRIWTLGEPRELIGRIVSEGAVKKHSNRTSSTLLK